MKRITFFRALWSHGFAPWPARRVWRRSVFVLSAYLITVFLLREKRLGETLTSNPSTCEVFAGFGLVLWDAALGLLLTIALSSISCRWLESLFLRLTGRFAVVQSRPL